MARPARLKVEVIGDASDAERAVDRFSSKVAGFTAGATAAVASFGLNALATGAHAAAGYLTDSVDAAAALSAALSTSKRVFGAGAAEIERWAKRASEALGLSELQALAAAKQFAVYGTVLGKSGDDLAGWSEQLAQLAADLGAFNDAPTAEVIDAIGSAFRGERDPLEKYGILLNDAAVKNAYFQETGQKVEGTLTTQQNIIGTLAAIEAQGAIARGAFAGETDQLANKQQILNAKWENAKAALGDVFLPVAIAVFDWITNTAIPKAQELADAFEENVGNVDDFKNGLQTLQGWLQSVHDWYVTNIGDANDFANGLQVIGGWVDAVEGKLWFLQRAWAAVWNSFETVWGIIVVLGHVFGNVVETLEIIVGRTLQWEAAIDRILGKIPGLSGLFHSLPVIGQFLGPISGATGNAVGRNRTAGPVFNFNVNVAVPYGVHAGDVGGALVASLEDWAARNGPLPLVTTQ